MYMEVCTNARMVVKDDMISRMLDSTTKSLPRKGREVVVLFYTCPNPLPWRMGDLEVVMMITITITIIIIICVV